MNRIGWMGALAAAMALVAGCSSGSAESGVAESSAAVPTSVAPTSVESTSLPESPIATTAPPTSPPPGTDPGHPPGTKTYVVEPGGSLSDVALRFGGDVGEILRLNGFPSVDTAIYPGQVLIVPDKPGVGPYFPGAGGTPPPPPAIEDVTCGQFAIGPTPFTLVAVSTPAGRVGCGEAFTVMEEFIATPGAPGQAANIRGWDCHPRENNFPECTRDGLMMFGAP